ncbi:hypothetical protein BKA63DRAFT_554084 [Paraphoma chrysanthemicola]|nr:hypothetical protein BKA63DRAFT_554084 [Paraphoma chrysanthemicola]
MTIQPDHKSPTFNEMLESDSHQQLLTERNPPRTEQDAGHHISHGSDSTFNDENIRTPQQGNDFSTTANKCDHESSTAVLWKGLPTYLLTWELLGIVLSASFLVLGACVASLHGKSKSDWANRVIQATRIAPSVWPIVFSGVLGNAVRAFADWRVERGIPLLALEQLLGSLTMASSVITIFRWSIFELSSVALVLLWAFNPLGSQASFRSAYLQTGTGIAQGNITAYAPSLDTQLELSTFSTANTRSPLIRALYSATLYDYVSNTQYVDPTNNVTQGIITLLGGPNSAAVQAATDAWGNVRIPNLEYHSEYDNSKPMQWLQTPWETKVLNYSSLLGEPVTGIDRNFTGNTSFTISSSYQSFKCTPWLYLNCSQPTLIINGTLLMANTSEADKWLSKNTGRNLWDTIHFKSPGAVARRTFSVMLSLESANKDTPPNATELIFASRGNGYDSNYNLSVTKCRARTTYVDAQIVCMSKGSLGKAVCGVTSIRETPNPPMNPAYNVLRMSVPAQNSLTQFTDLLDDNSGGGGGRSSNTEFYLYNPLAFPSTDTSGKYYAELGELDIGLFERRFSLLWNTLWKISWAKQSVMGGNFNTQLGKSLQNTTSHVTFPLEPVYAIDRLWLTIYLTSVGVMFSAAVFSVVMHMRCRAPTILGFASSLIRDSIYFEDRGVYINSTEDGSQKSKRLAEMKVMVADVGSKQEKAGKIAFAPVGGGKKVEKGKWYR